MYVMRVQKMRLNERYKKLLGEDGCNILLNVT